MLRGGIVTAIELLRLWERDVQGTQVENREEKKREFMLLSVCYGRKLYFFRDQNEGSSLRSLICSHTKHNLGFYAAFGAR